MKHTSNHTNKRGSQDKKGVQREALRRNMPKGEAVKGKGLSSDREDIDEDTQRMAGEGGRQKQDLAPENRNQVRDEDREENVEGEDRRDNDVRNKNARH